MRVALITSTVAVVSAAVLAVGAVGERNTRRALTREAEARLLLEARNLALTGAGALLSDLPELTLHPLVRELAESRPELAFAVVLDHRGVVQGHRDARALGGRWREPAGLQPAPTGAALRPGESLRAGRTLLVASAPVVSAAGQRLGTAVVGLERAYVERAVAAARRQQVVLVAGVLLAGSALAFLLLSALLRPIGPLRAGLERIGRGDLDSPIALSDPTELGLLADAVDDMAARLKVARREIVEKERLAHEVELAREIQQRLLPAGTRAAGEMTLSGSQRAAAEVGGDYFDVLPLPDGRLAVTIADVSGKGLGGCLVMSMVAALLRALRDAHRSPAALLVALEQQLAPTLKPGSFVTMVYGVLDPATGTLVYASAGHTPLLVWRAARGAVEWLSTRGIPIGAVRGGVLRGTLEDHVVTLGPGDLVFQFTDGCNEAAGPGDEEFGFGRIEQVVAAHATEGPEAVIAALAAGLERWSGDGPPADDQTVLAVARAAVASAPAASRRRLETSDPAALLARARAAGRRLELPPRLEALDALGGWLAGLPAIGALEPGERLVIETALYELCANVIEHGAAGPAEAPLELWWLPEALSGAPPAEQVRAGCFVLLDRGFPFRPGRRRPFDASRHAAWREGRGLGLDIVHRALSEVVFRPGTPDGNLTLLAFDPVRAGPDGEEACHG
jgi:serine phosphatase RsbU (regulator of sigma subunit)/anti-sigma regulatory factor (Ser/Thr protein kinase)